MANDITVTVATVKDIDVTIGEDHLTLYTTVERISVTDWQRITAILTAAERARDEAAQQAEWATDRAAAAKTSETQAKTSEDAAKVSEDKAKASETAANTSANAAKASEIVAKTAASQALVSETAAGVSAAKAKASEDKAKASETASQSSEEAARASQLAAKTSETNAKASETKARTSEVNAKTSETAAKASDTQARAWAQNPEGDEVVAGSYSALHWAKVAERYGGAAINALVFKGPWDATQGLPTIGSPPTADFYKITVAGTLAGIHYDPGDNLVYDLTSQTWFRVDNSDRPITDSLTTDSSVTAASAKAVRVLNQTKLETTGKAPRAGTADRWATERQLSLSGDAVGSTRLDGSADVTIPVTVQDNSHHHTIANVSGLQSALDGKPGEAPADGKQYARKNTGWAPITADVEEAPEDGQQYVRKDAAWDPVSVDVNEAPTDGRIYFRKNGDWEAADDTFIAAAPVGLSAMWHGPVPPAGWLEEDGEEIDKAKYPVLWQMFVGQNPDHPDKAFLPDSRGEFPRGWDHGRGVDDGRVLGSGQKQDLQTLDLRPQLLGKYVTINPLYSGSGEPNNYFVNMTAPQSALFTKYDNQKTFSDTGITFNELYRAGSETRPRNTARMFIIKATQPPRSIDQLRTYRRASITATAGQTDFPFDYDPGNNALSVIQNGSHLFPDEYTATRGTAITLTTPAKAGDRLLITDLCALVLSGMASSEAVGKLETQMTSVSNPNLLINGDFSVWQRGTSKTLVLGEYLCDRWFCAGNGAINRSHYLSESDKGFRYVVSDQSSGTDSYVMIGQNIESRYLRGLKQALGNTVQFTLSLNIAFSPTETNNKVYFEFRKAGAIDDFSDEPVIESGSMGDIVKDWNRRTYHKTVTLKRADILNGLQLKVGSFNSIDTNKVSEGSETTFGFVKLELGSVATPFIPDDPATNLAKCQRYYSMIKFKNNIYLHPIALTGSNASIRINPIFFTVSMRSTPTVALILGVNCSVDFITKDGCRVVARNASTSSTEYNFSGYIADAEI